MDPDDFSDAKKCRTPILRKEPLVAVPVSAGSSGVGLPYAPQDWPCPGDVWGWKVGKRMSARGHWVDRSLSPPHRLLKAKIPCSKQRFFSKVLVEQYVLKEFPEADVGSFFDSFIWKIPCKGPGIKKGADRKVSKSSFSIRFSQSRISLESGGCKAGNNMCSLLTKSRTYSPPTVECDICCSEAAFCHECCCILCCKIIDQAYNGYSFTRCEGKINKKFICGHVAHIDCALSANMAGTVRGSIGLDVEYCCRRCDNRTDLMSHVTRMLHTCQSLDSRDVIEKILNLALRILHGSGQRRAKIMQKRIESVMAKLSSVISLGDVWKEGDSVPVITAETGSASTNCVTLLGLPDIKSSLKPRDLLFGLESSTGKEIINGRSLDPFCTSSDYRIVSVKLEDEVDEALQELRKSQGSEFILAERKLYAQKDYLLSLYQQLEVERSELARQICSKNEGENNLLASVLNRIDKIKQEESRLRQMMLIAKGFGQVPKQILKEYFQFAVLND